MELPKDLVPDHGNFKGIIENALQKEENSQVKGIEDVLSLIESAQGVKGYFMFRNHAESIPHEEWANHFQDLPDYLTKAGKAYFWKRNAPCDWGTFFTSVYALRFRNKTELNAFVGQADTGFLKFVPGVTTVTYLRKDNYVVAIKLNGTAINDSELFENWYVNNFGMEKI